MRDTGDESLGGLTGQSSATLVNDSPRHEHWHLGISAAVKQLHDGIESCLKRQHSFSLTTSDVVSNLVLPIPNLIAEHWRRRIHMTGSCHSLGVV